MQTEEKYSSSDSGSQVESESPPPPPLSFGGGVVPQVMNMAVNMSMERSLAVAPATAAVGDGSVSGGAGMPMMGEKKKRGRPRKYDSNGNLRVPYMISVGGTDGGATSPQGFTLTAATPSSSGKRGRGRPIGSGNLSHLSSLGELFPNTAGGDFMAHVVTVYAGEDVAGKILSFAQKGVRGICVLSANGSVSNVTIQQPASSGGILTYEGRFEILSLTGSYTVSDNSGIRSRTGGLTVSLAGPDGRVIGGGVAGLLMAASPIQIVLGSFMQNCSKMPKRKNNPEPRFPNAIQGAPSPLSFAAPHHVSMPTAASAPEGNIFTSQTSLLPVQGLADVDNGTKSKDNPTDSANWSGSEHAVDPWPTPDINLTAPMDHQ